MNWGVPEEVALLLDQAARGPLVPREERHRPPILDLAAIEALIPQRHPLLFLDCVTLLDLDRGVIVARYDLTHAAAVFEGHFPSHPVWPGVLQVEAIGQAGGILHLKQEHLPRREDVALTRILGARFVRPVTPGSDVELVARVLEEGWLVTVVGQCLQNDKVCSVAALTFL